MNNLGFNKSLKNTNILVAMSGGVDSSVVAAMLKKQGYNVSGATMKLYNQSDKVNKSKSCCAGKDISDAEKVAKQFDFPHYILNYQESFYNGVIENFVDSYSNGITPIPCIKCNQTVKFDNLLNFAKKINADALITGHYVRRVGGLKNSRLFTAIDLSKDQSYFLFATTQKQLDYLRFPLGNYTKENVRKIAKDLNLKVKDKPDSQDICFVTKGSYADLIAKIMPESYKKGNILNLEGDIIGEHNGIMNYTIGQRRGIGIGGNEDPLYVIKINSKTNSISVGKKDDLLKTSVIIENVNWLSKKSKNNLLCKAKIKSDHLPVDGKIRQINNDLINFEFKEPVISIAPGQACVFYLENQVLGGGWIKK